MRTEFYLARRYLFRGKARHISFIGLISCLGVALGVAALIIAFAIVNGVDGGLMRRIMRFQDHLIIDSVQKEKLYPVKEELDSWEGVEAAYLYIHTQVFAKFEDKKVLPVFVRGIDFSAPKSEQFFRQYIKSEVSDTGFFVGAGLLRNFLIGDEIEFYPLKKKLKLAKKKVRGVFEVGLFNIDNTHFIGDLAEIEELSPNHILLLGVKLNDPYQAAAVKKRIKNRFPGIFVSTWIETNEALFATLKLEKLALFIILGLIVLIASFNIFAALTVKVVEKTKDIGVLRSLGFRRGSIRDIFAQQGVMVGVIGVALGAALGIGACYLLEKYPFVKLPAEIFGTEYLPVEVNYADVISIVIIGLVIALISSYIPALRAARLNISKSLRYE